MMGVPGSPFMVVGGYEVYAHGIIYIVKKDKNVTLYDTIGDAFDYISTAMLNDKLAQATKDKAMTLDECVAFIKAHAKEMKQLWEGY